MGCKGGLERLLGNGCSFRSDPLNPAVLALKKHNRARAQ